MKISDINTNIQSQEIKNKYNLEDQKVKNFEVAMKKAAESNDLEGLKKVAQDFEEIFTNMLMKAMRKTVGDSNLVEKNNQSEIFEGMLDEAFAKEVAESGGIGIADMMVKQLQRYVKNNDNAQNKIDFKA